jgi:two-component system, NtrC family, sensor kinase
VRSRKGVPRRISGEFGHAQQALRAESILRRYEADVRTMPAARKIACCGLVQVAHNEYKLLASVQTRFAELPEVKCNVSELNQVFLNLIVNAAHAIQESGKDAATGLIEIRTSVAHGMVEVAIRDNGCGIAPDHANKVFDPFFTTKAVGRGTGQGLSIARAAVVTRHGGTLSFETEVGRGTTFFVRIPVHGVSKSSLECPGAADCA